MRGPAAGAGLRAARAVLALRAVLPAIALVALLAGLTSGCGARRGFQPQLTGTCSGACAHYIQCKPGHPEADRMTCERECPDVFSDEESLMGYESLECRDAVEYIDGTRPQHAAEH